MLPHKTYRAGQRELEVSAAVEIVI